LGVGIVNFSLNNGFCVSMNQLTSEDVSRVASWVTVDVKSIEDNLRLITAFAKPTRGVLAVVKADGYGIGAQKLVSIIDNPQVWGYAVATVCEGATLRSQSVLKPILVLRPATADDLSACQDFNLIPVVDNTALLNRVKHPFHLEIDTGMGRSGIRWDDEKVLKLFAQCQPDGVFTHFHSADSDPNTSEKQLKRFNSAIGHFNVKPQYLHYSNSAGSMLAFPSADLIRPGIFLLGVGSGIEGVSVQPKPVISLKARIISVRTVTKGDSVSYDASWVATKDSRIATLGIGYADGIPRSLSNNFSVLLGGRRCPVVGKVTMDMTMIDVTDSTTDVRLGEIATVFGVDEFGNRICVEEVAKAAGTIPYELFTRLGPRLPRIFVNQVL
jgi:alanine racemase